MSNLIQCHFCGELRERNSSLSFMAKCCIKRCNKYYCIDCIQKNFQPEYDSQTYRKDTWICFFCQGLCSCERCKKSEQINIERKSSKKKINKTPPMVKNTVEQSIDNSQSNFSQSINNSRIAEQPVNQLPTSPNMQMNQSNDQNPIQEKEKFQDDLPKFKIVDEQELILMPKFMRKIVERKNIFYNFILNEQRKKIKNTKVLVKQNNRKYGTGRIRKQNLNYQQLME